jgi:hypothetical protein
MYYSFQDIESMQVHYVLEIIFEFGSLPLSVSFKLNTHKVPHA